MQRSFFFLIFLSFFLTHRGTGAPAPKKEGEREREKERISFSVPDLFMDKWHIPLNPAFEYQNGHFLFFFFFVWFGLGYHHYFF